MEKLIHEFSVGLFFWQSLIFLTLLFLLRKFAWKPILSMIKEREDEIEGALQSAEDAKKEMARLQASNEELLLKAREERDQMLKEAKEAREKFISEAKTEAKEIGDKMIAAAREQITTEKNAALAEMKSMVGDMSLEIAGKILKKNLATDESQKALVAEYLNDVKLN